MNMWTKEFRFCLFSLVYEDLLDLVEIAEPVDFESFIDSVLTEYKSFKKENIETLEIEKQFNNYLKNKEKFETKLIQLLPDWNKTFEIVKSILMTFQLEKQSLKVFEKDKLVVSYIKFAEGYCVSTNVKLIHAVLSKLVDDK
jgi:transcription termination factor NusB